MMNERSNISTRIFLFRFGITIIALLTLHVLATLYKQLDEANQVLNELAKHGMIPTGYEEGNFGKQQKYTTLSNFGSQSGSTHATRAPVNTRKRLLGRDAHEQWQNNRDIRTQLQEKIFTYERRLYESDDTVTSTPINFWERSPPGGVQRSEKYWNGKNSEKMGSIRAKKDIGGNNEYKKYLESKNTNGYNTSNDNKNKSNNNNEINNTNINNNNIKNNNDETNNNTNNNNNNDNDNNNNDSNNNTNNKNNDNNNNNNDDNNNNNKMLNGNNNKNNNNNNSKNNNENDNNDDNNNEERFLIYNHEQNKSKKENNSNNETKLKHKRLGVSSIKLMILAYRRSGSSFIGEMFNRNPRVFYLFEPIYPVEKIAGGGKYPLLYDTLVGNLLDVIYTCSFNKHPFLVDFMSTTAFRLKSEALKGSGLCNANATPENIERECRPLNRTILRRLCNTRKHTVVKTIRASSKKILEYFDGSTKLDSGSYKVRVIHLVRDPRAVINSRLLLYIRHQMKKRSAELRDDEKLINDLKRSVRVASGNLCSRIHSDVKYGRRADPGTYMLLRFEDAAMHPLNAYTKISEYAGIGESAEVKNWIMRNTVVSEARHENDEYSTSRNSTASVNAWRRTFPYELVDEVQNQCSDVMKMLGYLPARSKPELMNIEEPLVSLNTI